MALDARGSCIAIYHAVSEQDVENILRCAFTIVASDGGVPVFGKEAHYPPAAMGPSRACSAATSASARPSHSRMPPA
jgi:hypothetical protein